MVTLFLLVLQTKVKMTSLLTIWRPFPDSSQSSFERPNVIAPNFRTFAMVSEDDVRQITMYSPTKSCSLDPIPTFLVKECLDIRIQPITRMVNCSLIDGVFLDPFKQAIVKWLIKTPSLSKDDLKNYDQCPVLVSSQICWTRSCQST